MLFDVWLVARAATEVLDAAIAPSGLDADEFAVYSVLAAVDAISPGELARWMAAPPTTVSSYVKRFEARGHVRREPNPDDGRSYRLRLTPAGRAVYESASRLFSPVLEGVREALDRPEAEVREALATLRRALDHTRRDEGGL